MPYTRAGAAVIGGRLYVTGGYDNNDGGEQSALDSYDPLTRLWSAAGHICTVDGDGSFGFSGDGGQATSAQLALGGNVYPAPPSGVAVNAAGDLLIADFSNARIREVAG